MGWGYLYRGFELEKDGLRDEDLTSLGAEITNLSLQKLDLLSRPATANLEESVNDGVQVHFCLIGHDELGIYLLKKCACWRVGCAEALRFAVHSCSGIKC